MDILPDELIIFIFNSMSKITDKRQFLRTCILYKNLTKISMYDFESEYKIPDFNKLNYSVEKFTLELCHDGYFNLIPEHYININNVILIRCLSYYNNLPLLQLAKEKGCKISNASTCYYVPLCDHYTKIEEWTCALVAKNGHLSILKFLIDNDCKWNYNACAYAIENGHLDVLKYLYQNGCKMDKSLYNIALSKGYVEIIKWFEEIGFGSNDFYVKDM